MQKNRGAIRIACFLSQNALKKQEEKLEVEVTAVTTPEVDLRKVVAVAEKMGVKFRRRECIQCFW